MPIEEVAKGVTGAGGGISSVAKGVTGSANQYKYNVSVPQKNITSPSTWGSRDAVKGQLSNIMAKYGSYIKWSSKNSRVPMEVIASFIAVESGGKETAGGTGHITQGLMQWNRDYADSQLKAEFNLGRLTPEEKDKLASFGIKFDANGNTRKITNADQIKPELNILIGTIILGQLIDSVLNGKSPSEKWSVDANNNLRLDRIIAVYNAGAYGDTGKKARFGNHATPKDLADNVNSITSAYIKKMLGVNGAMDIASTDLKSTFSKYA